LDYLKSVIFGFLALAGLIASVEYSSLAQPAVVRIAVVTRNFNNPYWAALRDGAVNEGTKLNVQVNAQAGSSETDSEGENAKISTLGNQSYSCFAVTPVNATNVITPLIPPVPGLNSHPVFDRTTIRPAK
jgi:ribose transport system substrate-binding protein